MANRTPLYKNHISLNAKMVEFAGWEMPIQYSGVIAEHNAVRNKAGLFDVSHMGQVEIKGADAEQFSQYITTNDILSMEDGRALYSLLLNEKGTVVDDVIVYRFNKDKFIFVVNASNVEKDFNWIKSHKKGNVEINNRSDDYALIALQGPLAKKILKQFTEFDLGTLTTFHFVESEVNGVKNCIIARTGYTGEDGFEIFCPPQSASAIWDALLNEGKSEGVMPIGLGARDTLRMEMKYSLYGHEITDQTNPFEAGLSWVVKMNKSGEFLGKSALIKIKEEGITRKLIGFKMIDRAIPRDGYKILSNGKEIGYVTSGTQSPSLNEPIGIGYVPMKYSALGSRFLIDIRGKSREAEVVKTPFYNKIKTAS